MCFLCGGAFSVGGFTQDGISCADQGEVHSLPSALGPESKMGESLLIDMLIERQC